MAKTRTSRPDGEAAFRLGRRGIRYPSPTYAAAFLGLVRAAEQLDRTLDTELRSAHGISLRGFEVLLHLGAFSPDGRLSMTRLTLQAPLSQSRVSRLVAELERDGFVTRDVDERDTRAVIVSITKVGLAMLQDAQDTHYHGLERHLFSRLAPGEIRQLAKITGKLLEDASARSTPERSAQRSVPADHARAASARTTASRHERRTRRERGVAGIRIAKGAHDDDIAGHDS
ncbi:MAG TPA: MarR family winged helix-turn-helix transcriptional regulator [Actinomycetota bacterium]|nr:MarR family winged helix-turn-helix transcriptional regulator [Actinomycetota bacterium]